MPESMTIYEKMDYSNKELTKFLVEEFHLGYKIPYKENNRLRVVMGKIVMAGVLSPKNPSERVLTDVHIEYNTKFLKVATKEQVAAVGKHEALHLAMFLKGRPFNDGSPEFEYYLLKYNLPSHKNNRTITSASQKVLDTGKPKMLHYATCEKCNDVVRVWRRKPQLDGLRRYESTCCRAKLVYRGKKDQDDFLLIK